MTVGVLLLSHKGIAKSFCKTANKIWNEKPMSIDLIEVGFDEDTSQIASELDIKLRQLDSGDGVLVLTDLAGATPGNLVLSENHQKIAVVCGLNLPMLIKAYNYSNKPLEELARLTVEGGQKGIAQLA